MITEFINAVKDRVSASIQYAVWLAIAGVISLVAVGFFVSALYIWLARIFGPFYTSLIIGGGFLVLALLIMLIAGAVRREAANRLKRKQERLIVQPAALATTMISQFIGPKQTAVMMLVALVAGYLAARPRRAPD